MKIGCVKEIKNNEFRVGLTPDNVHAYAAAGHEVLQLHRRAFGPLELDPGLREGEWRELTAEELAALRSAAGMNQATEDA